MNILTRYCIGAMVTCLTLIFPGVGTAEMNQREKEEIVEMVIAKMKSDPTIAYEMLNALRQSAAADKDEALEAIKALPRMTELVEGNPQGDIIIMDFSDYGCEACNTQSKALLLAAKENRRIKIVLRDLPQSSEDARQASVDLLAVSSGHKNWKSIRKAYLTGQIKPEMRIIALAESGNYPSEADRELAKIALDKNQRLAERSGIKAGPAAILILGNHVQILPPSFTSGQFSAIIDDLLRDKE